MLINIATQTINSIGWVNDNTAILQALGHLPYKPLLRILRMNADEHNDNVKLLPANVMVHHNLNLSFYQPITT